MGLVNLGFKNRDLGSESCAAVFLPQLKKAVRGGRWGRLKDISGDLPTFNNFPSSENTLL